MDCQGDKKWQYLIIDLEKHCQLINKNKNKKHNEYEK